MARVQKVDCQDLVIGRDTGGALVLWRVTAKVNGVSHEWRSEGRSARESLVNVPAMLPAPHEEESMLPSWLVGDDFVSNQNSMRLFTPTTSHELKSLLSEAL